MSITNKAESSNPYLEQLVEDVIEYCKSDLQEYGYEADSVTITDCDEDRIDLDIDGSKFVVRIWKEYEIMDTINFDWQLNKAVDNHEVDINAGGSTFDKV